MQIELKHLDGLKKKLEVQLPSEQVGTTYENVLKEFIRTASIPGFRSGKASRSVVENKYKARLLREVTSELIRSTYEKAMQEAALRVVGRPVVDCDALEKGKAFEYTIEFEVYPEIEVVDLSSEVFEKYVPTITEADLEEEIVRVKKVFSSWKPVERAALAGDRVRIDYKLRYGEGEDTQEETGQELEVVLTVDNTKSSFPEFEAALVGLSAGEEKSMDLVFPENYSKEEFAGKSAHFDVIVKEVQSLSLPEDTEVVRFLQAMRQISSHSEGEQTDVEVEEQADSAAESAQLLNKYVREELEKRFFEAVKEHFEQKILNAFFEKNSVPLVPECLVAAEKEALQKQFTSVQDRDDFDDLVIKRIRNSLLFSKIVEKNQIEFSSEAINAALEGYRRERGAAFLSQWRNASEGAMRDFVKESLFKEAVVEALISTAEAVTEKPITYAEFLALDKEAEAEVL
eukprot:TRINITY_DN16108_c0_g1_i2.p2 TRINITY_DN16108_c0_g1~~TRINITY_DN16108_c0_g1_i2.p2  ORF type:complete len:458 (+),score=-20.75 TRINITY_DN16108_c0_g1_i2:2176-3549(+)